MEVVCVCVHLTFVQGETKSHQLTDLTEKGVKFCIFLLFYANYVSHMAGSNAKYYMASCCGLLSER